MTNASRAFKRAFQSSMIPLGLAVAVVLSSCSRAEQTATASPTMPAEIPALHHAGLNSTNPAGALDWYLNLWPMGSETSFAGRPAVGADMYLVFNKAASPPGGAFEEDLGRPLAQSAFWHIGAFANTTGMDVELAAINVRHLPLYVGPSDEHQVWRSGQTLYSGVKTFRQLPGAEATEPRPGGFSYLVGPDGALFEVTGGENTTSSLSHIHLFHEQPQCAANWYVDNLGMSLPPIRNEDATTSVRPNYQPCETELGEAGWPSLELAGTIRQPRGTVVHGNGRITMYPRQCVEDRCGRPQPLVSSRGQVLDHLGFAVQDVEAWHAWLVGQGVTILQGVHDIAEGSAFMFEGPDRLAIEFVQLDEIQGPQ